MSKKEGKYLQRVVEEHDSIVELNNQKSLDNCIKSIPEDMRTDFKMALVFFSKRKFPSLDCSYIDDKRALSTHERYMFIFAKDANEKMCESLFVSKYPQMEN